MFQKFRAKENYYERPNQKWICNWSSADQTCPMGPDSKGRCGATFECVPSKSSEYWKCTSIESCGRGCEEGPLPDGTCRRPIPKCTPKLTLRSKRRVLVYSISGLTIGLLLILIYTPVMSSFISPGRLSSKHSIFAESCEDCHSAASGGFGHWLKMAFESSTQLSRTDKCIQCHGERSGRLHDIPAKRLRSIAKKGNGNYIGAFPRLMGFAANIMDYDIRDSDQRELGCVTCHKEHYGWDSDLIHAESQKCRSCHQNQFAELPEFIDGHPGFQQNAYQRKTGIIFDHISHINGHFKEKKVEIDCNTCHLPERPERGMMTRDYEHSCAGGGNVGKCHDDDYNKNDGLPVFNFPSLDTVTLKNNKFLVGDWNALDPPAMFEPFYELWTPFLMLLLSGDPNKEELDTVLTKVFTIDDISYLEEEDKGLLEGVSHFAWAIKELYYELLMEGDFTWRLRLNNLAGKELNDRELNALRGGFSSQILRTALNDWCPNLEAEVKGHREHTDVKAVTGNEPQTREVHFEKGESHSSARWFYNYEMASINYRPTGHADGFLRSWLDFSVQLINSTKPKMAKPVLDALSDRYALVKCIKCHSIEEQSDGKLLINWTGIHVNLADHKPPYRYHRSHFSLGEHEGCSGCHSFNEGSSGAYQASFKDRNPKTFTSNFQPMTKKKACAVCHTTEKAEDSCLGCHDYHLGKLEL